MSGVQVDDEVKKLFEDMKVQKKTDDESKRLRFILFVIKDGKIVVDKTIREEDLKEGEDHFKFFRSQLSDKECCYALYDCHYETCESKKEELVVFLWAPDSAVVKQKMHYASSMGPLAKTFSGVKYIKQINDPGEYNLDYFVDLFGKNTVSIESCSVKCSQKKH